MALARGHLGDTGVVHQVPQPIGPPYERNVVPSMQRVPMMNQDTEQLVSHRFLPANLTSAHNLSEQHRTSCSLYIHLQGDTKQYLYDTFMHHSAFGAYVLVLCKEIPAHRLDINGDRSSVVSKSTRLLIFVRDRAENSKRLSCTTKTAGASCSNPNFHVQFGTGQFQGLQPGIQFVSTHADQ